jgi:hypothetical protein
VKASSSTGSQSSISSRRPINGLTTLPVRPSPSRQLVSPKKAKSPEVVDLDTDSDRGASKSRPRSVQRSRTSSPHVSTTNYLSAWIKSDVQPIRFEANVRSPQLPTSSRPPTERKDDTSSTQTSLFRNLPQTTRNNSIPPASQQSTRSFQLPKTPTVLIPPSEAQVLRRIKEDISFIRTNPREVEERVGVARFVDIDLNATVFQRAKQKRQKPQTDRQALRLELGEPAPVKDIKDVSITEPSRAVRFLLQERFKPLNPSLSFENRHNQRQLNGKFQFVTKYIWSKGVMRKKQSALPKRACQCSPNESCRGLCKCAIVQAKEPDKVLVDVAGVRPYERNPKGINVLSRELLNLSSRLTPIIFECTKSCSCGNSCANKVVQKGRTLCLQIFMTERCGF